MPTLRPISSSRVFLVGLLALCGAPLSGCNKKGKPSTESRAAVQEAKQVWDTRCVTCHGNSGKGDGPAAATLTPKPRSFSSVKWQASVDDAHIKKVIVGGGTAVGKSPLMAPNPDLKDKAAVLDELVKRVRSFAK